MQNYFIDIFKIFSYSLIGIIIAMIVMRTSKLLFGINLLEEIQENNKAASFFSLGLLILIGLIIGLVKP